MRTPLSALPEITLCAVDSVPPMVLFDASPDDRYARGVGDCVFAGHVRADKVAFDWLFIVPASLIRTPAPLFPEMRLSAVGSSPPDGVV